MKSHSFLSQIILIVLPLIIKFFLDNVSDGLNKRRTDYTNEIKRLKEEISQLQNRLQGTYGTPDPNKCFEVIQRKQAQEVKRLDEQKNQESAHDLYGQKLVAADAVYTGLAQLASHFANLNYRIDNRETNLEVAHKIFQDKEQDYRTGVLLVPSSDRVKTLSTDLKSMNDEIKKASDQAIAWIDEFVSQKSQELRSISWGDRNDQERADRRFEQLKKKYRDETRGKIKSIRDYHNNWSLK